MVYEIHHRDISLFFARGQKISATRETEGGNKQTTIERVERVERVERERVSHTKWRNERKRRLRVVFIFFYFYFSFFFYLCVCVCVKKEKEKESKRKDVVSCF